MSAVFHFDQDSGRGAQRREVDARFERSLLRRSLGLLAADRHRCADCQRTPLIGERVHVYEPSAGIVCELCRMRRTDSPVASQIVRHSERGHAVRLAAQAA